jgi:trehalose 6-phosphate phosphatase
MERLSPGGPPDRPLLAALDEVGAKVDAAPHVLLLLDFDGTLAPIVDRPEDARMPGATRASLARLAARDDVTACVVSGRAIDDVRDRVGIAGLIYAGDHGMEIDGPGLHLVEPTAERLREGLHRLADDLAARLVGLIGVEVERKRMTATVHHRRASPEATAEAGRVVRDVVPEGHPDFALTTGKAIWEVRPRVDWHKGSAVLAIRDRLGLAGALPIYLGDDRTDEDAFAAIGPDVTARVGPPAPSLAHYRLADPDEVGTFLAWLARRLDAHG